MAQTATLLIFALAACCAFTFVHASSFNPISTDTLTISGDDNVITFTHAKVSNISFSLTFDSVQPNKNGTATASSISLSGGSWSGEKKEANFTREVYTVSAGDGSGDYVFTCDLYNNGTSIPFANNGTVKVTDNSLKISMNITNFEFKNGADQLDIKWKAKTSVGNITAFHGSDWDVTSVFVGDNEEYTNFYLWLNFPLFGQIDNQNATAIGVNATASTSDAEKSSGTASSDIIIRAPQFKKSFFYDPDVSIQDTTSVTMSSSGSDKTLLYIIFAVIGGFVLACLVAITLIIFFRSRKRAQYEAV